MAESAYQVALKILSFRARTTSELKRQLLRKGHPASEIDDAISRLHDQKLLDDADFARQFARSKLLSAGRSRRRVVQELGRKGVDREVADRAIAELAEDEGIDPGVAIHRVAEKKWNSLSRLDDFTRRRRLYAFLARRGFDVDEIRAVMAALGGELET
jgi:regulatory protein